MLGAFDRYGQKINHHVDAFTIKLSKNYGLLQFPNLYIFPESISSGRSFDIDMGIQEYVIAGMDKQVTGISNLTMKQCFDLNVGDEIHITEHFNTMSTSYYKDNKWMCRVIQKNERQDTLFITMEYEGTSSAKRGEVTYENFTVIYKIPERTSFDTLPFKTNGNGSLWWSDYMYFYNDTILARATPMHTSPIGDWSGCLNYGLDQDIYEHTYLKGLAGPYYNNYTPWPYELDYRKLVYFKKGTISWGVPLNIDQKNYKNGTPHILFYPNPAYDRISIETTALNISSIQIFNVQGKLVKQYHVGGNIDVSELSSGAYILKINHDQGFYIEKLFIQ